MTWDLLFKIIDQLTIIVILVTLTIHLRNHP